MQRLQIFEIHEQPWCPAAIREGAMACLCVIATVGRQYQACAPLLQQALLRTGATRIVDLCAGRGGPWPILGQILTTRQGEPVEILLTDLYPSEAATGGQETYGGSLRFLTTPVDATRIPRDLPGFRTLFTAFHHFPPAKAQAILQDAVNGGQGIAIFEQTARTPLALLIMYLLPWFALVVMPLSRPWRFAHFFWTFVVPAIPLVLWFDGIVSCLRTYSASELATLVEKLAPPPSGVAYVWRCGKARSPLSPLGITYLIGYPKPASRTAREDGMDDR